MTNYTTTQVSFTFYYDGTANLISIDINKGPLFYRDSGILHTSQNLVPKGVTDVSISNSASNLTGQSIATTAIISGSWLEVNIPDDLLAGSYTAFAVLKY